MRNLGWKYIPVKKHASLTAQIGSYYKEQMKKDKSLNYNRKQFTKKKKNRKWSKIKNIEYSSK